MINNNLPINFYSNSNKNNSLHPSTPISFGAAQRGLDSLDKAITKYLEKDNLTLADRLKLQFRVLASVLNLFRKNNYVGEGHFSVVSKISDDYVLKSEKHKKYSIWFFRLIKKSEQPFSDIKSYFGSPLFDMGFMKILRNAKTSDTFMPCGVQLYDKNKKPLKYTEQIKRYDTEYLPMCASLPQKSYDALLKDINKLGERGYGLDEVNPGNVVISNNQFKIVDDLEPTEENTLMGVLTLLLLKYDHNHYAEPRPQLFNVRKEILRKALIASEKSNMYLGYKFNSYREEFDILKDILYDYHTHACDIFDKIYIMRDKGFPLKNRIEQINAFFENVELR